MLSAGPGTFVNRNKLGSFVRKAEDAPTLPGAHVLMIELTESVEVTLPGKPKTTLKAGCYLYCGSAKGPGGIRARLSWHMRPGKLIHWHVDRLTNAGRVTGAWVFPGRDECERVRALSRLCAPIRGFGNTDCPKCWSHLLSWPRGARRTTIAQNLERLDHRILRQGDWGSIGRGHS